MVTKHKIKSTINNMLDGAKSIINLFPSLESPQPLRMGRYGYDAKRSDAEALASDWHAVGNDLRKAMGTMNSEIKQANH